MKAYGQIVLTDNPYWDGFVMGMLTTLMAGVGVAMLLFGQLLLGSILLASIPAVVFSILRELRKPIAI